MPDKKRKRPAPSTEAETFKIIYKGITRELSRAQLAKAPNSLLGKILLNADQDSCSHELAIPSEGDAPGCAVWQDGDKEVFEACMDCYTGGPTSSKHPQLPVAKLKPALVDFFNLPREMWPVHLRLAVKAMEQDEHLLKVARPLLCKCAEMMDEELSGYSAEAFEDADRDIEMSFVFHRKQQDSDPTSMTELDVSGIRNKKDTNASLPRFITLSDRMKKAFKGAAQEMKLNIHFWSATDPHPKRHECTPGVCLDRVTALQIDGHAIA